MGVLYAKVAGSWVPILGGGGGGGDCADCIGTFVQVPGDTMTGPLTMSGAAPSGTKIEWLSNGAVAGRIFPFGTPPTATLVLQSDAAGATSVGIQGGSAGVTIDGAGVRSGEFRSGFLNVGDTSSAAGNPNVPLRLYGNAGACQIQFYHGAAPQSVSGFTGFNTATEMRIQNSLGANGLLTMLCSNGDVRFAANGNENARFQGASFLVNTTNPVVADNNPGMVHSGSNWIAVTNTSAVGTPCYVANKTAGGLGAGSSFHEFRTSNNTIGSITRNAQQANVLFNTTSDYRLKIDHGRIGGALERLERLIPRRVVWRDDPTQTEVDGFFAHEVAEAVPEAVTGAKDAVADADDEDRGLKAGQIIPQQLDASVLVPLLVAAVQELSAQLKGAA